jgi:hypothetical protein
MKLNSILLLTALVLATGCANVAPQGGLLFHDIKYGVDATEVAESTRRGEACTNSILGLVGFGDASIEQAKMNGKLTKVSSVDASSFSVLGFYNKYCTIVKGN